MGNRLNDVDYDTWLAQKGIVAGKALGKGTGSQGSS